MARGWQPEQKRSATQICGSVINFAYDGADLLACARLVAGLGIGDSDESELLWRRIVAHVTAKTNPNREDIPDLAACGDALVLLSSL